VPVYWRSYVVGRLKGHRSRIERAFVERLVRVALRDVPHSKLIVTADRGFADVLLIDLLESLKIAFVIRAKENVKVFFQGQWRIASQLDTARQRSFRLDHVSGSGEKFLQVVFLLALPEGKSGGGQFARYRDPRQFRTCAAFDQTLIISLALFITERG